MNPGCPSLTPVLPAVFLIACATGGCVSRPPTIAHTHIGHTVTAVHVTPDRKGYLEVAEERAATASEATLAATADGMDLAAVKAQAATIAGAVSSADRFGLKQAVIQAANHLSFAATADDASANLREFAPGFERNIVRIVERCELMELLTNDIAATDSLDEARVLAANLRALAKANVDGEDDDGDGVVGGTPAGYGMAQLRKDVDAMLARENPPYAIVDSWYLFNLVRLPNGLWVWDKLGRGGNIEGYQ
ncbi:MAG: hypothetical protein ACREVI_09135 [Steroidobacteraceae bacterium]